MFFQYAIFVDAGYLHAAGSTAVSGSKLPRHQVQLNVGAALDALCKAASEKIPNARFLRTYWYDGLLRNGRMSSEQEQLAQACDCKLRLGVVNSSGEQKGVDSLIVTDLIELSRNRAITDALVVSGDEDIRVGVQIAQTFGVKVHLLGVAPSRGNQSPDLFHEVDSHTEFSRDDVLKFMVTTSSENFAPSGRTQQVSEDHEEIGASIKEAIATTFIAMDPATLDNVRRAFAANPQSVPQELDRPALGKLKSLVGRELTSEERKQFRASLRETLASTTLS